MTNNLFKSAVEKRETNDFFRGERDYFVPSPDYEGHVHGAMMSGHARNFADESVENARIFDELFIEFIQSLNVNREDLNHLLANLSSYFANRSRDGFAESNLFESNGSPGYIELYNYLGKVINSEFCKEAKDQIEKHSKFIEKKGSNVLANIYAEISSK